MDGRSQPLQTQAGRPTAAPGRGCSGDETQPPTPPSPLSVRRVGGGYEWSHGAGHADRVLNVAAFQTLKALPAQCTPYTVDDVRVVALILRHAEAAAAAAPGGGGQAVSARARSAGRGGAGAPSLHRRC